MGTKDVDDGLEPANVIQSGKWIIKNSDIDKSGKKNKMVGCGDRLNN